MHIHFVVLILHGLIFLTTPILSQYNEIKPDVTFGDHNDRFDVSNLLAQQNRYFRTDGSIDYRRSHKSKKIPKFLRTGLDFYDNNNWAFSSDQTKMKLANRIKKETQKKLNKIANMLLMKMVRRAGEDDFAFHDNMESEGGDVHDFNENLVRFEKRSIKSNDENEKKQIDTGYRRVGTSPDLFNYAFPIEMQVKGFLLPPEDQ